LLAIGLQREQPTLASLFEQSLKLLDPFLGVEVLEDYPLVDQNLAQA
jgi:hypothetical protein